MRRTRRVEITVETSRIVVRLGVGENTVWCAECSGPAHTVTSREAAALAGATTGSVDRQAGAFQLHFIESAGSMPLVCLKSLLASFGEGGEDDAEVPRGLG